MDHSWGPSHKYYLFWKNWTEYKYEYYSVLKNRPNTNTNIIQFENINRIWIRILFGLKILTEYEYEYYSVWKNWPNTNTNIIRFENINRIQIRILFGLQKSPEYEYEYQYSASTIRIIFEYRIIRSPLNYISGWYCSQCIKGRNLENLEKKR